MYVYLSLNSWFYCFFSIYNKVQEKGTVKLRSAPIPRFQICILKLNLNLLITMSMCMCVWSIWMNKRLSNVYISCFCFLWVLIIFLWRALSQLLLLFFSKRLKLFFSKRLKFYKNSRSKIGMIRVGPIRFVLKFVWKNCERKLKMQKVNRNQMNRLRANYMFSQKKKKNNDCRTLLI